MKHTCFPTIVCTLLWPTVMLSQPAWHAQTSPVEEDLVTVSFASATCGWAVGYYLEEGDTLWSVDAIDPPAFWIVGEAGTIIFVGVNTIFGAQVLDQSLDIPYNLYEIDALDNSLAWAVGESGTILHFGTEGGAGIPDPPEKTFSIFPNPATDHVMVTRQSEEAGWVKIYNLQGRLEQTIEARAGEVRIDVSLETLKTGQYIVQSGNQRKLLLVIR